jgi:hypothetical protein
VCVCVAALTLPPFCVVVAAAGRIGVPPLRKQRETTIEIVVAVANIVIDSKSGIGGVCVHFFECAIEFEIRLQNGHRSFRVSRVAQKRRQSSQKSECGRNSETFSF